MYEFPTNGRQAFQVGVYNRDVRALVKENKSHDGIRDEWADVQRQEVLALNEQEAKEIMLRRYPEAQGFVVESVALDTH